MPKRARSWAEVHFYRSNVSLTFERIGAKRVLLMQEEGLQEERIKRSPTDLAHWLVTGQPTYPKLPK